MLSLICISIAAISLVLTGIFIAANNPTLAQKFKTSGTKAIDAAKALAAKTGSL
jgi:hypothetical protein